MFVLAISSLKEAMEHGSAFSLIITSATRMTRRGRVPADFCAWQRASLLYHLTSRKRNSIWKHERYARNTSSPQHGCLCGEDTRSLLALLADVARGNGYIASSPPMLTQRWEWERLSPTLLMHLARMRLKFIM